jgi:hypothetical protein
MSQAAIVALATGMAQCSRSQDIPIRPILAGENLNQPAEQIGEVTGNVSHAGKDCRVYYSADLLFAGAWFLLSERMIPKSGHRFSDKIMRNVKRISDCEKRMRRPRKGPLP